MCGCDDVTFKKLGTPVQPALPANRSQNRGSDFRRHMLTHVIKRRPSPGTQGGKRLPVKQANLKVTAKWILNNSTIFYQIRPPSNYNINAAIILGILFTKSHKI